MQLSRPLTTTEQLDEEVENFMAIIEKAAWKDTPVLKRKTMGNNYPKEIWELIVEKRRARTPWQQTGISADETKLNNFILQIKREIQEVNNESVLFNSIQ
jgi:hypothetical protein